MRPVSPSLANLCQVKLCSTLLDVDPEIDCIIVGTIYKNMKLKPCVLDEYMTDVGVEIGLVCAEAIAISFVPVTARRQRNAGVSPCFDRLLRR